MRDYHGYVVVKVGAIDETKLKKAVRNGKITIKKDDLKGNKPWLIHPIAAALIEKAQKKGRGVTSMMLSADDIIRDIEYHDSKSMWSWLPAIKHRKGYDWVYPDPKKE